MSLRLAPRRSTRTRPSHRPERRTAPAYPFVEPIAASEVARHRRAGGPEDSALYACPCGLAFDAEVSASVDCPRCGTAQAW